MDSLLFADLTVPCSKVGVLEFEEPDNLCFRLNLIVLMLHCTQTSCDLRVLRLLKSRCTQEKIDYALMFEL